MFTLRAVGDHVDAADAATHEPPMGIDTSRLAMPGDKDLDFDVDGTTVASVVRMGHEIWLRCVGGFGWWVNASGREWTAMPGDSSVESTEIEVVAGFPTMNEEAFGAVMGRLEGWRDSSVPIRVCMAPGRLTVFMEDHGTWICLPRTAPDV